MAVAKSDDSEQLCNLVAKLWQDFDAQNAGTAYQKLLLMRTAQDTLATGCRACATQCTRQEADQPKTSFMRAAYTGV